MKRIGCRGKCEGKMDYILFVGGIVLSVCSFIVATVYFFIYKLCLKKLNSVLEHEYGKKSSPHEVK